MQELEAETVEEGCLPVMSLCLCSVSCPEVALPTVGQALPHQSTVKEMYPWLCPQYSLFKATLQLRFSMPR